MRRVITSDWAPSLFVFASVPVLLGLAGWAPAYLEFAAAAVGLVALLLMGRCRPEILKESLVVIAAGTAAEFTFAPLLGWYDYAGWAVPPWVPVGHGLVWMAARTMPIKRLSRPVLASLLVVSQLAWMLIHWQVDAVGLLVGLLPLLVALAAGLRGTRFIAALVLLVWWVEIWGATITGAWSWSPYFLGLPEISPPGSAAGGYLWLIEGPALLAWFAYRKVTGRLKSPLPGLTAAGD